MEFDPKQNLIQKVLGDIAEYVKEMTIQNSALHGVETFDQRSSNGNCEGRKSYHETDSDIIAEINRLHRKPKNGK